MGRQLTRPSRLVGPIAAKLELDKFSRRAADVQAVLSSPPLHALILVASSFPCGNTRF